MKRFSSLISILATLYFSSVSATTQNEDIKALFALQVAKSGCCKVRQSSQHPWAKTGVSFAQCENNNNDDGDSIYNNSGSYWWDRSC